MNFVRESLLLSFPLQPVGLLERALQPASPSRSPSGLRGQPFCSIKDMYPGSRPPAGPSEARPSGSSWVKSAMSAEAGAAVALPQGTGRPPPGRGALPRRDVLPPGPMVPVHLRSSGHRPAVCQGAHPGPGLRGLLLGSAATGSTRLAVCQLPARPWLFPPVAPSRPRCRGLRPLGLTCQGRRSGEPASLVRLRPQLRF